MVKRFYQFPDWSLIQQNQECQGSKLRYVSEDLSKMDKTNFDTILFNCLLVCAYKKYRRPRNFFLEGACQTCVKNMNLNVFYFSEILQGCKYLKLEQLHPTKIFSPAQFILRNICSSRLKQDTLYIEAINATWTVHVRILHR